MRRHEHHFCSQKCFDKWLASTRYHSPSTWSLYNGQLMDMRQSGMSLQEIGNTVGRTRERIRQLLEKHYQTTEIENFITRTQLAKELGTNWHAVRQLELKGLVNPILLGYRYLYDKRDIDRIKSIIKKACVHCGEPIPLNSKLSKYCPECSKEHKRYHYPFLSEVDKKRYARKNYAMRKRRLEKAKVL